MTGYQSGSFDVGIGNVTVTVVMWWSLNIYTTV